MRASPHWWAIGSFWMYPRCIGTTCNCCLAICHLAAIIIALKVRFRAQGEICLFNTAPVIFDDIQFEEGGRTYQEDGYLLGALAICQVFFFYCQITCCWIPCLTTPISDVPWQNRKTQIETGTIGRQRVRESKNSN